MWSTETCTHTHKEINSRWRAVQRAKRTARREESSVMSRWARETNWLVFVLFAVFFHFVIGGRSLGRSGWACLDRKDPPASLFIDSFLKDRSFIGLVRSPPHIGVRLCRVEVRRIRPLVCRDRARTDRSTSLSLSLSLFLFTLLRSYEVVFAHFGKWQKPRKHNRSPCLFCKIAVVFRDLPRGSCHGINSIRIFIFQKVGNCRSDF